VNLRSKPETFQQGPAHQNHHRLIHYTYIQAYKEYLRLCDVISSGHNPVTRTTHTCEVPAILLLLISQANRDQQTSMTKDTDEHAAKSSQKHVTCRECTLVLAILPPAGIAEPPAGGNEDCPNCAEFRRLHANMIAANDEWLKVQFRAESYEPRSAALKEWHKARKEMANFLDRHDEGGPVPPEPSQHVEGGEQSKENGPVTLGTKRSRRQSLSPETLAPSPKRRRKAKTVSFHESVVFNEWREDRNTSLARFDDNYERGKYAPPDEGFLDTSGCYKSYEQFSLGVDEVDPDAKKEEKEEEAEAEAETEEKEEEADNDEDYEEQEEEQEVQQAPSSDAEADDEEEEADDEDYEEWEEEYEVQQASASVAEADDKLHEPTPQSQSSD
jgi:hypothetical protein